jgi:putative endonuclease
LLLPLFVFALAVVCLCCHPERSEGSRRISSSTTARIFRPHISNPQRVTHARRPRLHPRQHHGTLYTGVTSKFDQRLFEHKTGIKSAFASKYKCNRLLLYERYVDIRSAIAREKEIKGWTRSKKLTLISKTNPEFKDLATQYGWLMLHPQQNIADQK